MSQHPVRALRRATRRACAAAVLTAAATAAVGVAPAYAADAPTTFFTMLGGGDYIGGTSSQLFHPGNATLNVSGTASRLSLSVSGGTLGKSFILEMAAPSGQTLVPGTYENAMRYPFQTADRPGISVFGDGRGCNTVAGRFVVHDMAVGETGVINRFSATYEHNCEGGTKALIGQVSINQPRDEALLVAGDELDFPEVYPNAAGRTVPVWVHNRGAAAVTISGTAITGEHAAAFAVTSNGCTTLAAGATCAFYVRYRPATEGAHTATLTISDSTAAGSRTVPLSGRATPGHTGLSMRSEQGDYIGGGGTYDYTPANATISANGGPGGFALGIDSGGSWWTAQLEPAAGDVLEAGRTYTGATRAAFTSGVGMDVSGSGRGCNTLTGTFHVIEAVFKDGTGPVERFAATFEQHCEGGPAALYGWVSWRASAPNVPPPGPLAAPTALTAYPDVASAVLAWDNPEDATTNVVRGAAGLTAPATPTSGTGIFSGKTTSVYVGYLTPGASYSFSVFAQDAAGNVSPAAKITLRGSALTLKASASTVTYGSPVTLTAKLVDAGNGAARAYQEVDLYARKKGAREYFWVDTLRTSSSGVATFAARLDQSYEFQVVYRGAGTALGVTAGPLLVNVRTRISVSLSRTTVARYGAVTISGSVAPNKAGRTVYLQRWVNGAWKNYTSKTLSTSSTYAFTIRPSTAGTWKLRVYRPADSAHAAGASATRTLTVT